MSKDGDSILAEAVPEAEAAIRAKNYITMEVLQHLFHSVPFGHSFELSNGMTGTIRCFFEPKEGDDEKRARGGIDVNLSQDGKQVGHIEFTLENTGWGMAVCAPDVPPEGGQ